MAIGIFAIAIVAIMGLFGSSMKGVKSLADRDALSGVVAAVSEQVAALSRADLAAIPAGSAAGSRPVYYCFSTDVGSPGSASTDTGIIKWTNNPPTGSAAGVGKVFRVTLYRAIDPSFAEYAFSPTNQLFPIQVVVDALAPGQTSGTPDLSWSFHKTVVPDR